MAPKDDALGVVRDFENAPRSGMWSGIVKPDVIAGLRVRINDPKKIDQAGTDMCGPATFAYQLATDDPAAYAKAVIDLFTGGTAVIGTRLVKPGTDLMFTPLVKGSIDPADWILLASLRDSSNWLIDVEDMDEWTSQATIPSTIVGWLEDVGYTKIVDETNVWFTKDSRSLKRASGYLSQGYRVMLFINDNMLYAAKQGNPSIIPEHWIMLLSPIKIEGPNVEMLQTVSFHLYSWGTERDVPEDDTKPLKFSDLLLNYYGFIAFKH